MKFAALLLSVSLMVSGCATAPKILTSLNPFNWGRGNAAAKQAKTEKKQAGVEDGLFHAAHLEMVKMDTLLAAVLAEHSDDVTVTWAKRTGSNALALMDQIAPLGAADRQQAVAVATGLAAGDKAAVVSQEKAEGAYGKLSRELESVRADLKEARDKAAAEAAQNLELARELGNQRFLKWGGIALSGLLSIAVIAYRLNIGRLQTGAAEMLAAVTQKHGEEAGATARSVLDGVLHTGEQRGVAKAFFALTRK